MGWERRGGKFFYYRKQRVAGRVRSIYFGSGERAETASREDNCPHPLAAVHVTDGLPATLSTDNNQGVTSAPMDTDKPCATPRLGEVGLKKERVPWPTLGEVLREWPHYSTLRSRYLLKTLPMEGERLTAWVERRDAEAASV